MASILLVGKGEVGDALYKLEEEAGNNIDVAELDRKPDVGRKYDVMHVCIPYTERFIGTVIDYGLRYAPNLAIIHSTVPVGTTEHLSDTIDFPLVVHSPVRGVHPHLYKGLKTFIKYVGGYGDAVKKAIEHLKSIGIQTKYLGSSETTELAKILSTTYYGWNILFAKEAEKICKIYGLKFEDVYTHANKTYNDGYTKLGRRNVVRPVLYPPKGTLGGHCLGPNFEFLPSGRLKRMVKELNENE